MERNAGILAEERMFEAKHKGHCVEMGYLHLAEFGETVG